MMQLDIEQIFSHHPPRNQQTVEDHENIRAVMLSTARVVQVVVPDSPEKTLAIRHLQSAMMFANSAIAQYGDSDGSGDRV